MNLQWIRPDWFLATFVLTLLGGVCVLVGFWLVRRVQQRVHRSMLAGGRLAGSRVRIVLRSLALVSWAIALAGPSWGQRTDTPTLYQREVLVAADLSVSMRADDLPPNRLVRMREMIHRLFEAAPGYRYGLIVFAGEAWERVPFTYDRGYLDQVLAETDPADIQPQGTDLAKVLERAVAIAARNGSADTTLVLFTDGEHTGESNIDQALTRASQSGLRILAVSLGVLEGAAIPLPSGGYLKDAHGEIVYSKPDRTTLDRLAQETGGLHVVVDDPGASLDSLAQALQSVEAKRHAQMRMVSGIDRSVWWIALGWLLLCLSLVPLPWLALQGRWHSRARVLSVLMLSVSAWGCGPQDVGARAYRAGDFAQSARWYAGEAARDEDPALLHNLGASLYRLEQFPISMTASAAAATRETEPGLRGDALYNAGNAAYRAGDYMRAVQLFRAALDARDDEDTRVNLEIALRKLAELQQKAQQPRPQPQPKPDSNSGDTTAPAAPQPTTSSADHPATDAAQRADARPEPAAATDATAGQVPDTPDTKKPPERSSVLLRKRLEDLKENNALAYPDSDKAAGDKPW